ncbi:GspH/FimT family pseudopilin [Pseudomonas sp. LS44]|uniref:GspH/FimT family pseudopilin n=1 Tax=Pseudomonas sp. LS44 TaxID=1357074 RepID=UPI00215B6070|nr:GspH/FimT family pseudopilin [Pseudomonas sp. LS44]UVE18499.1 GspH/FimT family pseudopilin [Pseudomonas sp. LS44]
MLPKPHKAFSLIELLCALTLLSLFISITLPNFSRWIELNRTQSLHNLLYTQLYQARTSSVLHNRDVEVCGSSNGQDCDDSWQSGWLLRYCDTGQLITQHRLSAQDHLRWAGFTPRIRFHENGTAPLGNGRFYLCDRNDQVILQVVLNRQGRLRRVNGLETTQDIGTTCL